MPVAGVEGIPSSIANAPATVASSNTGTNAPTEVFHPGDVVAIFRTAGDIKFDPNPWSEHIRDDGTITPPEIGSVKVADRTPLDLQRELQRKYEVIYRGITVTVTAGDRYYHVVGEVNAPGPKVYLTKTDITQAISSAGGLNEFASWTLKLFHPSGKFDKVDYAKALKGDPKHNLQVYPGDRIVVTRRWL